MTRLSWCPENILLKASQQTPTRSFLSMRPRFIDAMQLGLEAMFSTQMEDLECKFNVKFIPSSINAASSTTWNGYKISQTDSDCTCV